MLPWDFAGKPMAVTDSAQAWKQEIALRKNQHDQFGWSKGADAQPKPATVIGRRTPFN